MKVDGSKDVEDDSKPSTSGSVLDQTQLSNQDTEMPEDSGEKEESKKE